MSDFISGVRKRKEALNDGHFEHAFSLFEMQKKSLEML